MNELQKNIFEVICSIILTRGITENFKKEWQDTKVINHGAIRYGYLNYIARFSLANDNYFVTSNCKKYLIENYFLDNKKLRRGKKSQKNKFTYEHPVPSNIVGDLILQSKDSKGKIKDILMRTNLVTVMTSEENSLLNKNKLGNRMPENWTFDSGDFFARYKESEIEIPSERIKVHGAIAR